MATAGWYGDPTREGRLRYWDGSVWTEHVSEGGGTAVEAIAGIPPAPPAGSPVGAAAETTATPAVAEQPAPVGATQVSPRVDPGPAAGADPPPLNRSTLR